MQTWHLTRRFSAPIVSLLCSLILVAAFLVTPVAAEDFDGDGDPDTVISVNTVFDAGEYTFGDLLITNGAVLTLLSNPSAEGFKGVCIHAHCIKVDAGSAISANGKGYVRNSGPGAGLSGAGGGYGGVGAPGQWGGTPGGAYGSVTQPIDLGSGGGSYMSYYGGSGGGAIWLDLSGSLTIEGTVSARGNNGGRYAGGGSGGSIYLAADSILGGGAISADGGAGGSFSGSYNGGGGGGGRIAAIYNTDNYSGTLSAYGGVGYGSGLYNAYGGAGTILTKSYGQLYGDLLIDNHQYNGRTTPLLPGTVEFDCVEARNSAKAIIETGCGLTTGTITVQSSLVNSGNLTWTDTDFQGGTLTNNGLVSVPNLVLDNITFVNNGMLGSDNITIGNAATLEQNSAISLENLTIQPGGVLTSVAGQSLDIAVSNALTVEAGGSINVNGKGYAAASGPGAGLSGAGAGYGGVGGLGEWGGTRGGAYGSVTEPDDLGSGGGTFMGYNGGSGGGAIRLDVSGMLTVDGTISANGNGGNNYSGAGSGGSIYITADTLLGSGAITADGGRGGYYPVNYSYRGGGGGGGRIAIYCTDNYSGAVSAYGGEGYGTSLYNLYAGAGTIFTSSGQSYGELLIDNNQHSGWTTPLPMGIHEFDDVEIRNSGKLVVESGCTLVSPSVGTDPAFQGGTLTNNGLVSTQYLSKITFVNNAVLNSPDHTIVIGNGAVLQQDMPLSLINLTIESGGLLTSGTGGILDVTVSNALTIEAGGSISVNGKGNPKDSGDGAGLGGAGAGYGGIGGLGRYGGTPGGTYGSPTEPTDLGSGGGSYMGCSGGAGGGAIWLNVSGTLAVDGAISANGNNGGNNWAGGGSGGSIYIVADTLVGGGAISADGGGGGYYPPNHEYRGGGGGGGRIAIYYCTNDYSGTMSVAGGIGYQNGGEGTIYTEEVERSNVWVDDDYGNPYPGTGTPSDPFHEIQMGIDALESGVVHVAAGTYFENVTLKSGVKVIGTEGAAVTTINGGGAGSVVTADNVSASALLAGFTITNGNADDGGGIALHNSDVVVMNCVITLNSADYGGGVYVELGSPTFVNCVIANNQANKSGGMYCTATSTQTVYPVLTNCTIAGNSKGGFYNNPAYGYGKPILTNCIIWGNDIFQVKNGDRAETIVTYSDIQGGYPGEGNINSDPLLTADYHLESNSPCIDQGSNDALSLPDVDIDGETRIYNDTVDMGADEYM